MTMTGIGRICVTMPWDKNCIRQISQARGTKRQASNFSVSKTRSHLKRSSTST